MSSIWFGLSGKKVYHFLCFPFFCWFPSLCINSSTIWFSLHHVCLLNGSSWSRALISPSSSQSHLFSCLFKLLFHLFFPCPCHSGEKTNTKLTPKSAGTSLALNLLLSDKKHPFPFLLLCFIFLLNWFLSNDCPIHLSFLISERFATTLIPCCCYFLSFFEN